MFRNRMMVRTAGIFFFAFLGGMAAQFLLSAGPVQAAQQVWESYFTVKDETSNKRGIQMYVQNGATAQKFNDPDGYVRLQLGTYGADEDKNMPMFAMSDNKGNIRLLMRLRGPNQSPVLIMRDDNGRDRVVLGLEETGFGQEPYLSTYDSGGQQIVRFSKLQ